MNDSPSSEAKRKSRLRWVTLGETIAIAALIVSAIGVWLSWKGSDAEKGTTTIVERRQAIPLTLRGRIIENGKALEIRPVEDSHSLQSLSIAAAGKIAETGSSGRLSASDFEDLIGRPKTDTEGKQRTSVRVTAEYVEAGADKSATGSYTVSYRWEGGGLFSGRHVRLEDFSR